MTSQKRLARTAGVLYLLVGIFGGFAQGFVYPKIYAAGDAATTAGNLVANSGLVRIGVRIQLDALPAAHERRREVHGPGQCLVARANDILCGRTRARQTHARPERAQDNGAVVIGCGELQPCRCNRRPVGIECARDQLRRPWATRRRVVEIERAVPGDLVG